MESENVNFDEFAEEHEVESAKESEQYRSFIYFYGEILNQEDVVNQVANQKQVSIPVKS